jgi:hypothetical protein
MARTTDFEAFLAPESAVGAALDQDDLDIGPDTYIDPADDLLDGLAASGGMYEDGGERHVREVLGRVFGM